MERILGVDVGEKRIGVAISDPLGVIARELEILDVEEDYLIRLCELLKKYDIKKIIVGWPINLKGVVGFQAERVQKFIDQIKKFDRSIEIIKEDERFSSKMAKDFQRQMNVKKRLDSLAATIFLQNYLDRN